MSWRENKSCGAQALHRAAMNWAQGARGSVAQANAELEQKFWAGALEYELKALDCLLSEDRDNVDVPNIILFSKYAAFFALNTGDRQTALNLIHQALAREPDKKMKEELLRLMSDVQSLTYTEAEQNIDGSSS